MQTLMGHLPNMPAALPSCRLIKHTYPALHDHPSVDSQPPIKGLDKNNGRVLFIDHTQQELQQAQGRKWRAAAEHQSKVNMHEVSRHCCAL